MAQIIHTIEVIPPEITPEARAAIAEGSPFHIELQEPAETEREKKEKRKTTLKAIVSKYENNS